MQTSKNKRKTKQYLQDKRHDIQKSAFRLIVDLSIAAMKGRRK